MGIKVYHSLHSVEDIKRYLDIANKYNLIISGGSGYHTSKGKKGLEKITKEDYDIEYQEFSILEI